MSKTIEEQIVKSRPGKLNWTLTKPNGSQQRGEEVISESEWFEIMKQLAEARARHIK